MLRLTLLVTAIISFTHFVSPQSFSFLNSSQKVLGIEQIQTNINLPTVKEALNIYCINHNNLPVTLDVLYESELSRESYVNLDATYNYQPKKDCQFNLSPK